MYLEEKNNENFRGFSILNTSILQYGISQIKTFELSITSVSKVMAPRKKRYFCRTAAIL
jgi:hypothetical protein